MRFKSLIFAIALAAALHAQAQVADLDSLDQLTLGEVVVEGTPRGNHMSSLATARTEVISITGLKKMACCSVAESFENSAAVSVGYSDAVSGARQIRLLGLNSAYTQTLDESRPVFRGISAPWAMSYVPGVWLKSIEVSKGIASVVAGHDAITGQINLNYRKPVDAERLFINFYLDDMLRPELNITSAIPLTRDNSLSTIVMAHGALDTDWREMSAMDRNGDGFRDTPKTGTLSLANRWLYIAPSGMQLRWGWNLTLDSRTGGTLHYKHNAACHEEVQQNLLLHDDDPVYGFHAGNRLAGAYAKLAIPVGEALTGDDGDEKQNNIALIADFEHFRQEAYYGLNDYYARDNNTSLSAIYSHNFTTRSSLVAGAQWRMRNLKEHLYHVSQGVTSHSSFITKGFYDLGHDEHEAGAFAEYTLAIPDRLTLVAGVRGDYNSFVDRFFFTPRAMAKWNITATTTLRGSAGLGFRTANPVGDNTGVLATGLRIYLNNIGDDAVAFSYDIHDIIEKSFTWGASVAQQFRLGHDPQAQLSIDYFGTRFYNTLIASQEYSPTIIALYNSHVPGYSHTLQLDFSWQPVTRLDVLATVRYTRSRQWIAQTKPNPLTGNPMPTDPVKVEQPLTPRFKALLNVQYATKFRIWVFDATLQLNGKARIPAATANPLDATWSPTYAQLFAQVTRKVGKWDLYLGCENITDYRQKNAINTPETPWNYTFNSMNVWGPLMGRKFYIGFRLNVY